MDWDPKDVGEVNKDEYTNTIRPPELIRAAIIEEFEYVNLRMWEVRDMPQDASLQRPQVGTMSYGLVQQG